MQDRVAVVFLALAAGWSPVQAQQEAAAQPIVAAEHAFAARALAAGVNVAFSEYLAADGVVFRPAPVNARAWFAQQPPNSVQLEWRPALVDISSGGDFGYSTGPWRAAAAPGEPARAYGYFLTVWRREPDGAWRALLDHGVTVRAPLEVEVRPRSFTGDVVSPLHASSAELRALDALPSPALHPAVRLYAAGALHEGAAARAAALPAGAPALSQLGAGAAPSGDLAYTYGSWSLPDARGHYVRVWRRAASGWQLVVELYGPDA